MENKNEAFELPKELREVLDLVKNEQGAEIKEEKIHATSIGGVTSFVYEKIRNVVEYRDQNLFRKNAVKRYLIRNIQFGENKPKIGEGLVIELIKTRYLLNDSLSTSKVETIDRIIDDYSKLGQAIVGHAKKKTNQFPGEVIGMMAVAIERTLVSRDAEEMYVEYVYSNFKKHTTYEGKNEESKVSFLISLYAGIHRSLLKSDMEIIKFYLFNSTYPDWQKNEETITECARDYVRFNNTINPGLNGNLPLNTQKIVRKNIAPFIVLRSIIFDENFKEDLPLNQSRFSDLVEEECAHLYVKMRSNLLNSVVRSIIFIFITKMALALVVEVPYNRYVLGETSRLPLLINLAFPLLYLVVVGLTAKIPGESNTGKIKKVLVNVLYGEGEPTHYVFKEHQKLTGGLLFFFNLLYFAAFVGMLSLITWLMLSLKFTFVDGIIFFIFLSTVSFFGNRIKNFNREIIMGDIKRNFFSSLWDFLYNPFMRIGQWLSDTYAKINVFTFILDFVIEAPLKSIIKIADQWASFAKEKNEDLY